MTENSYDKASRVSATSIAEGDIVGGKYRIDSQLGVGGMGVVLAATHLELDAPVAIKVIRDDLARNEEVVGRMLFEARAAAKLRSAHVVRVLDVARLDSGAPYIVMERLEGSDLATVLTENGPLPVQEAVDYVLQACDGLLEAHALGIVHRDLKPENLFRAITPEGSIVKVLDFGISKDTGVSPGLSPRAVKTSAGDAVGSPYYMSPEQMRALEVDARTDIWSLGAILYELLSGHCPFEGESLPVVCASVLSDVEAAPLASLTPRVSPGLSALVARCLRKERAQRFESVAELAAELSLYASIDGQRSTERRSRLSVLSPARLHGDRSTATPAPMAATMALAAPRPRASGRLLPAVAGLLVVVSAGLAWFALRTPSAPNVSNVDVSAPPSVAAVAPPIVAPAVVEPPVIAPQAAALPAASETAVTAPNTSRSRALAAKRVVPASPAAPALAPPPPSAAPPIKKPAADAWNPDRLGGRY
ncbi:MAG TPA: serine/threonine-protein kinase [Polyangiaceae bacterium]|nr:serine/threonine-protein kinase [Polyangiaceae bacterium]